MPQLGTSRERPAPWAPSHRLGCSSEPPSKAADSTASDPAGEAAQREFVEVEAQLLREYEQALAAH